MNHKKYTLSSPVDFTNIPPDRLDACLADFKIWVDFGRKIVEVDKQIEEIMPGLLKTSHDQAFVWIDDGIVGGKVNVSIKVVE